MRQLIRAHLAGRDLFFSDETPEILETGGWVDRSHEIDPLDPQPVWGAETRVRLTLTGGPAARPSLADLRVATI